MKKRRYVALAIITILALSIVPILLLTACGEKKIAYGDWKTVTAATCEETGVEMRVALDDPQISETRSVPANGHDWNEWQIVTQPTCLVAGVQARTCKTCDNRDVKAIPATGHKWSEWETQVKATCESRGTRARTCLNDNTHTELESVPATGHDYSDWVITLAPTCTDNGVETCYCRNDNAHTQVRAVQAYGHSWNSSVTYKAATCTEDGVEFTVCRNDKTHVIVESIPALGHDYGDWVVSVPVTENQEGEMIRVCSHNSAHSEKLVIPTSIYDSDTDRYNVVMQPLRELAEYIVADLKENGVIKSKDLSAEATITSIRYAYGRSLAIEFREIPTVSGTEAKSDFLYKNRGVHFKEFVGTNDDYWEYVDFLKAERAYEGKYNYEFVVLPLAKRMAQKIKTQYEEYIEQKGFDNVSFVHYDTDIVLKSDCFLAETYNAIVNKVNGYLSEKNLPLVSNEDILISFGGNTNDKVVNTKLHVDISVLNFRYSFVFSFNADGEFTEEWINYYHNSLRTGYSSPLEANCVPGNEEYAEFYERLKIEEMDFYSAYFHTIAGENTFLYF